MARDDRVRVGLRLKGWRKIRELTQEALAERAGLSYKFIGEIERGRGNPTIDTLSKLAHALDVDLGDLFGGAGAPLPVDTYELSVNEVQTVREAARSLEDVVERWEAMQGRRRRPRKRPL